MDSFERFNETSLPPKEAFYSSLKMEKVKDKDYEHAKRVWDKLGMQTTGQYHNVYIMLDTLLLADVFEEHRIMGFEKYGLDPAHYFTPPSFAWDRLLKMTQKELELLTEYDMHLFIERGTRGGISTVREKRHAKANNPYMVGYDKMKETSYIMYLDENNEYGRAMMQHLPTGNFWWLKRMPTEKEIMSWGEKRRTGAILEVDLEYPEELHDLHNGYPLAPERSKVPLSWHSEYQKTLARKLGLTEDKTEKLLLTLNNKTKYEDVASHSS